ncbi:hypothetical protein AH02_13 [Pseudomonas phage AH02]|nr:hypothetical protein AH02_13 [Pseudomonas phage AH02]
METQEYKVRAPDGQVIKLRGPAGADQATVIAQAQKLYGQGQQAPAAQQEAAQPPVEQGMPDSDVPQIGADGQVVVPSYSGPAEPSLGESIVGAGETALALGTGATGGAVGMVGGTIKGILDEMAAGKFGSQEAADRIEKMATDSAGALTYAPRTQAGQDQVQAVGEAVAPLAALGPLGNEVGMIAQGAKSAAPLARSAAGEVATQAKSLIPTRASVPADRSIGAAQVAASDLRASTANNLPVPVKLTKGAQTRNPDQLAFEKEQMKTEIGQPLRDRAEENNLQVMQNFDALIDDVGSGAVDVASTGNKVIDMLSSGYKSARSRTKAAYTKARESEESNAPVDLTGKVKLAGDDTADTSLIDYLNSRPTGVPSSAVTDAARKFAVKLGVATEDADGNLKPLKSTVGKMEDFRKEVSGIASRTEPGHIRDETIIKKLVDAHTDPAAGQLYKAARAERTKQARKYENRAIVARLITNRKGGDDPKVAADQVFQKSIINSSPEEINFLRRVMLTSGNGGRQAWKDVQGALVDHIREQSTKGLGTDSNGNPLVSPAKLNQTVAALDKNGRLDVVLGKKNAQIVRDLNDVAKYINTVPPGTLINNSGTAGTIMAAIGEAGLLGASTGIPLPILTGLRQLAGVVKSKKAKAKVEDALNNLKPSKK